MTKQESDFWKQIKNSQYMKNRDPERIECRYPAGVPDVLFKRPGGFLDFLELKVTRSGNNVLKVAHITAEQATFSERYGTRIVVKVFRKKDIVYASFKRPDQIEALRFDGLPFSDFATYDNVDDMLYEVLGRREE